MLTQKDKISNISRKGELTEFATLPPTPTLSLAPPPPQLDRCGGGSQLEGGWEHGFSRFCLDSLARFSSSRPIRASPVFVWTFEDESDQSLSPCRSQNSIPAEEGLDDCPTG